MDIWYRIWFHVHMLLLLELPRRGNNIWYQHCRPSAGCYSTLQSSRCTPSLRESPHVHIQIIIPIDGGQLCQLCLLVLARLTIQVTIVLFHHTLDRWQSFGISWLALELVLNSKLDTVSKSTWTRATCKKYIMTSLVSWLGMNIWYHWYS